MPEAGDDERRFLKFVKRDPILSVLSDAPLAPEDAHFDRFNLIARLGPVYDILRHPDTRTPLAVAIYGDWGSGKSSAMRWLQGALEQWQDVMPKPKGSKTVRTVWFEPWKYHTREDVWRGLMAEVVLHCIDVKDLTADDRGKRLISASSDFGRFLGRSFLHALKSMSVKLGTPGAEVEAAPGQAIDAILTDYQGTAHPEKAFLNEFESTLRNWTRRYIAEGERLVVFIDDLDRCLPEVALEVLEALKLYLNIERLVFVVGVAHRVVQALVRQHYLDMKVPEVESRDYLAKMFQVEVHVAAGRGQVDRFLDGLLDGATLWNSNLEKVDRDVIRGRLHVLAHGNPREVKRMVNEVLIYGTAVLMALETGAAEVPNKSLSNKDPLIKKRFAQALQGALIRRFLEREERYAECARRYREGEKDGSNVFRLWSEIVRQNPGMPVSIPWEWTYPEGLPDVARMEMEETPAGASPVKAGTKRETKTDARASPGARTELPNTHAHLQRLWAEVRNQPWRVLLADENLGELMRVEYPTEEAMEQAKSAAQAPPAAAEEKKTDIQIEIERAEEAGRKGDPRFADPLAPLRDLEHRHWVVIPAGEFLMGAHKTDPTGRNNDNEAYEDEGPVHPVRLGAYKIGRYPVTVAEYAEFVKAGGYTTKAHWSAGGFGKMTLAGHWEEQLTHPTWPVVNVSWYEAMAYAAWATSVMQEKGRKDRIEIPTEAQWERAARGTDGRKYPWGNSAPTENLLNFAQKVGHPTPVGVYRQGATPEGICDMAGNVWEWCQDWFGPYGAGVAQDPQGPANGNARVCRGGSWVYDPRNCRSACRILIGPGYRLDDLGFRVAVVPPRTP